MLLMSYVLKYVEARYMGSITSLMSLTSATLRMWSKPWQEKRGCFDIHELVNPLGSLHMPRM